MFAEILNSIINPKETESKKDKNTDTSGNIVNSDSRKTVFRLPISYLEDVHPLQQTVSQDLELLGRPFEPDSDKIETSEIESERDAAKKESASRGMYEYLLNPQHQFALETIPLWNAQFTTDISFLTQSQQIVKDLKKYKDNMENKKNAKYKISCDKLLEIWTSTRDDSFFLERFSYMEWSILKYLNENTLFLQTISLANIASPVISFLLPILFLILPFISTFPDK